jgi:hypothetical protein
MWGLAMGACLVWVVTQAHVVSGADSQSRPRGLRLLLPSVSVQSASTSGRVSAFNFRISKCSDSGAAGREIDDYKRIGAPNNVKTGQS